MRIVFVVVAFVLTALPAYADTPRINRLYELMQLSTSVEILRDEGLQYALESEEVLFNGPAAGDWQAAMREVYDVARLEMIVTEGFSKALSGVDLTTLIAFYESQPAQRVLELELSARRAFLIRDVEEEARAMWRQNPEDSVHADAIRAYIEVNDLIERNVIGAMNSNVLFLRALAAGEPGLSEAQILEDVWGEEEAMRIDTREWMFAFLTMAYAPLDRADMQANLAIWETEAGQALNNAIFIGFDDMLERVSEDLGAAAARMLVQEEL